MKDSELRRREIKRQLFNIDNSTKKEIEGTINMVGSILGIPVIIIKLLEQDGTYSRYCYGMERIDVETLESTLHVHCIPVSEIREMRKSWMEINVDGLELSTPSLQNIKYCTMFELQSRLGESIGKIFLLDIEKNRLSKHGWNGLRILSREIVGLYELKQSLHQLKDEISKVQQSELKLKSVFQSSRVIHILFDMKMKVLAYNRIAYDIVLRYHNVKLAEGMDYASIISPSLWNAFRNSFMKALFGNFSSITEKIMYDEDHFVWWQLDFNPVYDFEETITGVSMDVADVTDTITDKANIQEQNSVLSTIAQMQSHEIRKPLANILGLTELMEDCNDENYLLHLDFLRKEALDLDKRIYNIVSLSNNGIKD